MSLLPLNLSARLIGQPRFRSTSFPFHLHVVYFPVGRMEDTESEGGKKALVTKRYLKTFSRSRKQAANRQPLHTWKTRRSDCTIPTCGSGSPLISTPSLLELWNLLVTGQYAVIAVDFVFTGVTFALRDFSSSRSDFIIVMQVLTIDTFFSHTPYFRQNRRKNGDVLLAYCIAKGQ